MAVVAVVAVEAEDDSEAVALVSREVAEVTDLDVAREVFREDFREVSDGDRVGSAEVIAGLSSASSSRRVLRDLDLDFEFEWLMIGMTQQYFL